ncbi:MAG: hypothetical protein COT26_00005 [Candidatus Kerfeldbacteria bacterium CG08_land_8_20_14_0_20_43_14]|uniref:STAS domain-containing protein n=1 Tax=Candidatus Kerfeldbacteria bacterium CG08_land_8_20_14_0_20_43_14 TaxID=2014246 RepID=A0A2H0YTI2_9BACT|nr:MAG: hypothetical protein COT26_00005 [Candidatus Kerfeldbacteria bacterium CG08_land_8_20_14_0_20_43_14]
MSPDAEQTSSITAETKQGILVVALRGNLDSSNRINAFREKIDQALDKGIRKFIINLSGTVWVNMNSIAIHCLIAEFNDVQKVNGEMVFCYPQDKFGSLLTATRINGLCFLFC